MPGRRRARVRRGPCRGGPRCPRRRAPRRCGSRGTVALGDEHGPPAVREPALGCRQGPWRCRRGTSRARACRAAACRRRGPRRRRTGDTDHHIMPSSRARSRTSAMDHSDAAPTSMGASPPGRGGRPGRLEELLRGGDEVGGPGPYPLRVADPRPSIRRAARRGAVPCRRRGPARGTPCPRRRCPRRSCPAVRPAQGAVRRGAAALARTSAVSSSSRQVAPTGRARRSPGTAGPATLK